MSRDCPHQTFHTIPNADSRNNYLQCQKWCNNNPKCAVFEVGENTCHFRPRYCTNRLQYHWYGVAFVKHTYPTTHPVPHPVHPVPKGR